MSTKSPTKQAAVLIRLLKDRPHRIGAEIGVNRGATQLQLLEHLPGLELIYAVDPWEAYPDYRKSLSAEKWRDQHTFDRIHMDYLQRVLPHARRVFVIRAYSRDAARVVPDGSLDFVFIDANHFYDYVRADIAAWTPKVRPGGIVAGHDYLARSRAGEEWGVIRAVREAFGDDVVEHYLNNATVELNAFNSAVTDWERVRGFERL